MATSTHHEKLNLPSQTHQSSKGGWRSAIFIIFVEMAERFAYYGVAGNLITYLSDVMQQTMATAAKNVNVWQGVSAVFPLLGAFVADSYVGRFWTIIFSSIIYFIGLILLTITVAVAPSKHRKALFFLSLYIIAVGEGGHKPCVQTFAADQFDEELPKEKAAKSSFFNWWYLGIVTGATSAILVVIYVQDYVRWSIGYGMLAAVVAVALAVFLIGSSNYRTEAPVGSPFTRVAQVFVAAVRKRRVAEGSDGFGICLEDWRFSAGEGGGRGLVRTSQFRFFDKAMIIDEIDASSDKRNPWRLCSLNQVEEVKLVLSLIPIWLCCLTFAVVIAQLGTFFTKQGGTLSRKIGSNFHFPPASLQIITGLTILCSVPAYDRLLVPVARKFTGHPSGITVLQRIGTGIALASVTMVVAALVESRRVTIASQHGLLDSPKTVVPMSVWWLLPQYMLCGLSDVFAVVGMQELFYGQMPEEMRSIGAAAYISVVGVGSFMSGAIISVIQEISSMSGHGWLGDNLNRAHLDLFYLVLAGLNALGFSAFVCVAWRFVYKKTQVVDMKEEECM